MGLWLLGEDPELPSVELKGEASSLQRGTQEFFQRRFFQFKGDQFTKLGLHVRIDG